MFAGDTRMLYRKIRMDPHSTDPTDDQGSTFRGRRKRITAREVDPTEDVERETRRSAGGGAIEPDDLLTHSTASRDEPPETAIVDPTLVVGQRHRRQSAHFKYRCAQLSIALSLTQATVAIACVFIDEPLPAQILSGGALVFAVIAIYIVRHSGLAYRLRGYAAAAGVLAAISLGVSFLPVMFR